MSTSTATNHRPRRPTDAILDRTPPSDLAAERCLLGSILLDPRRLAEVAPLVAPDDFHDPNHREVARALWGLHVAGTSPDLTLVADRLRQSDIENVDYCLVSLSESVGVAAHAAMYAGIVARKARQRAVIRAAADAIARVHEDGDPETIGHDLQAELADTIRPIGKPKFVGITCAELARANHEVEYLVPGVLVRDQPGIIGGIQKTLKTTIAWDLGISLSTGEPFLGRFEVARTASVAFFSGEGGLGFLQDVGRRICAFKRLRLEDVENMVVCDRLPRLDSPDDLRQLGDLLTSNGSEVAFFDPVYLAMGGADAGNVLSMGERLGAVNEVCVQAGVTPILLHHLRKTRPNPGAAPELTDLSWSGFAEFAGQWILLSRRTTYTPNPRGRHELLMSTGGRTGHSGKYGLDVEEGVTGSETGRYWHVDVFDASEVEQRSQDAAETARQQKQDERVEADAKKVVSAMLRYPDGETPKMIRDTAGLSGTRFTAAIATLIQDGAVVSCEVKKPNRTTPYEAYKLVG